MTQAVKKFRLLKHQTEFINDTHPNGTVGLVGGFRAGKTYALVHKAIKLAFLCPGEAGALLEPTATMLRRVLLPTIEKVFAELGWVPGVHYKYRKSNPESFTIFCPGGQKSVIYLLGAEKYDRLAGMTLAWFGFDEVDRCKDKETALAAFKEATARLTTGLRHGFCTSTPEGFHFMHHYFVENGIDEDGNQRTDRKLYRARTFDNPYIHSSYITRIRTDYTPKQAEAYLNGEFVNLVSGNVYYAFDRAVNHTHKTVRDFRGQRLHVGMDFNVGNMSAVVCAVDEMTNHLFVLEEITGELDTDSMCRRLRRDYADWARHADGIYIYPDSSGKSASANASMSSIAKLRAAGFKCFYTGNNPSIMKERVPAVNAMFKSQKEVEGEWKPFARCFVNVAKCPVLVKGLEQQGFGPDGKPDKTSGLDHCLDAFGYVVAFKFPIVDRGSVTVYR